MFDLRATGKVAATVNDAGVDRNGDANNFNHSTMDADGAASGGTLAGAATASEMATTSKWNGGNSSATITATIEESNLTTVEASTSAAALNKHKRFAAKRPKDLRLKLGETVRPGINNDDDTNAISATDADETDPTAAQSSTSNSTGGEVAEEDADGPREQVTHRLDIGFENISLSTTTGFFRRETKEILKGVSGQFRAGELTAIIGPSGAGKTTLVNILSSYTTQAYTGTVTINGSVREEDNFKPHMAFITQDTSLQPHLTVNEAMFFAAHFKIGTRMTPEEKRVRVRSILKAIGLYEHRSTRSGKLSGGQKKRLAIALELVNNPTVLILDEPTSGLDSFTSNQCISILKKLALEGRTIICTIHQPSGLTFKMIDQLYCLAKGQCIYAGGTQNLVPFLSEIGLPCPESYNPADYLMEIATDDYGYQNDKLVEKMENGRNESYLRRGRSPQTVQMYALRKIDDMMASGLMTPVTAPIMGPDLMPTVAEEEESGQEPNSAMPTQPCKLSTISEMSSRIWDSVVQLGSKLKIKKPKSMSFSKLKKLFRSNDVYATPFHRQLGYLLARSFIILWRDKTLTLMRFSIHFSTALLIGLLYYNIGNDANSALNNLRYIFYTIMFVMFCSFSSILVKFPLEYPIISREHFNRWYSLRAYYLAITLADIPIQMMCSGIFVIITYFMTNQPAQAFRLLFFSVMILLTASIGQSIGLCVGASLSVKLGAILGPFFICPFLQFSGFFLQLKDTPVYFQSFFHISFLKHSLDGSVIAIYGYDRERLHCSDLYCHYSKPSVFLKDMDMENVSYATAFWSLLLILIILRVLSFYIMSIRLRLFR